MGLGVGHSTSTRSGPPGSWKRRAVVKTGVHVIGSALVIAIALALASAAAGHGEVATGNSQASTAAALASITDATDKPLEAQDSTHDEEIVVTVTATRVERPVAKEPVSVYVVTREELIQTGARTVGDAMRWVPGVNISGGAPFAAASRSTAELQGLPAQYSLVLVDGERAKSDHIHTGVNLELIPVSMIERIEVIRGPGSVVHGSDALGGIINIITRPVPAERATGLQVMYGSENTTTWSLHQGDHSDRLGWLVTGVRDASDGIAPGADYNRRSARLRLLREPNDPSQALFDLSYYDGDYTGSNDRMYTARMELLNSELRGGGRIQGIVAYTDYHRVFKSGAAIANNDMWHSVVQYDRAIDGNHYLIAGMEWRREAFERLATSKNYDTIVSLYAQDEWQLRDSTTLLLGGRIDRSARESSEISPRGALHWSRGPADVRLSIAKGFRLPSLQDLFEYHYDHGTFWRDGNPDLRPETSMHISLDGAYRLAGSEVVLRGLLFANDIDNMIALRNTGIIEADGDPVLQRANIRKARTRGYEIGTTVYPRGVDGVRLDLSYAYLDARDETTDEYLAYNPRNTVKAGAAYRRGPWSAVLLAQFVGGRFYRDTSDTIGRLDDYFLVDLDVGLALAGSGRVDFAVKNVFDKEFESYEEGKALDSYGRFVALTYRREF
jgi:outer membrane receptor for ferrienterochelin and colicins